MIPAVPHFVRYPIGFALMSISFGIGYVAEFFAPELFASKGRDR